MIQENNDLTAEILTKAQKRELAIMVEMGSITTWGYGRRHRIMTILTKKGLALPGKRHPNIFNATEAGIKLYNTHHNE
jgi:hypothetical protein